MAQVTFDALPLLALALLAVASAFLLYVQRPRFSRPLVYSSLPWLATGAVLRPLAGSIGYPGSISRILEFPFSYVLVACLCVLTWTMLVQLRTSERARSLVPTYLGMMGLGTLLGPFAVLVLVGGAELTFAQLLSWLVMPFLALVATYAALVAVGLFLPRTAAFAGSTAGVVLFGSILDALVLAFGASLVGAVPDALAGTVAPVAAALGVAPLAVVVWSVLWIHLAVAVVVVAAFATVRQSRPRFARSGLHLAVVLSVLLGTNSFAVALSGGVVV
jgi:uncharacterized membrane protein